MREDRYIISKHAHEELSDDELTSFDIEQAILTGKVAKRFVRDPRGTRYEIIGYSADGREIGIVCRILADGSLRIITAYAIESEEL